MKLFLVILIGIGVGYGDKLDRTYLPPPGFKQAGGSPGSLDTPIEYPNAPDFSTPESSITNNYDQETTVPKQTFLQNTPSRVIEDTGFPISSKPDQPARSSFSRRPSSFVKNITSSQESYPTQPDLKKSSYFENNQYQKPGQQGKADFTREKYPLISEDESLVKKTIDINGKENNPYLPNEYEANRNTEQKIFDSDETKPFDTENKSFIDKYNKETTPMISNTNNYQPNFQQSFSSRNKGQSFKSPNKDAEYRGNNIENDRPSNQNNLFRDKNKKFDESESGSAGQDDDYKDDDKYSNEEPSNGSLDNSEENRTFDNSGIRKPTSNLPSQYKPTNDVNTSSTKPTDKSYSPEDDSLSVYSDLDKEPRLSDRDMTYQNGKLSSDTQDQFRSYPQKTSTSFPRKQGSSSVLDFSPIRANRPQAGIERNAETLIYENDITPEGDFAYSFDTSNGIHADEQGTAKDGVKAQGGYSYTGDDGKIYSVIYSADENGFQPQGDHLPTPPPTPKAILRVIEQAQKNKEAGVINDGSYDDTKYGYQKYDGLNRRNRPQTKGKYPTQNKKLVPGSDADLEDIERSLDDISENIPDDNTQMIPQDMTQYSENFETKPMKNIESKTSFGPASNGFNRKYGRPTSTRIEQDSTVGLPSKKPALDIQKPTFDVEKQNKYFNNPSQESDKNKIVGDFNKEINLTDFGPNVNNESTRYPEFIIDGQIFDSTKMPPTFNSERPYDKIDSDYTRNANEPVYPQKGFENPSFLKNDNQKTRPFISKYDINTSPDTRYEGYPNIKNKENVRRPFEFEDDMKDDEKLMNIGQKDKNLLPFASKKDKLIPNSSYSRLDVSNLNPASKINEQDAGYDNKNNEYSYYRPTSDGTKYKYDDDSKFSTQVYPTSESSVQKDSYDYSTEIPNKTFQTRPTVRIDSYKSTGDSGKQQTYSEESDKSEKTKPFDSDRKVFLSQANKKPEQYSSQINKFNNNQGYDYLPPQRKFTDVSNRPLESDDRSIFADSDLPKDYNIQQANEYTGKRLGGGKPVLMLNKPVTQPEFNEDIGRNNEQDGLTTFDGDRSTSIPHRRPQNPSSTQGFKSTTDYPVIKTMITQPRKDFTNVKTTVGSDKSSPSSFYIDDVDFTKELENIEEDKLSDKQIQREPQVSVTIAPTERTFKQKLQYQEKTRPNQNLQKVNRRPEVFRQTKKPQDEYNNNFDGNIQTTEDTNKFPSQTNIPSRRPSNIKNRPLSDRINYEQPRYQDDGIYPTVSSDLISPTYPSTIDYGSTISPGYVTRRLSPSKTKFISRQQGRERIPSMTYRPSYATVQISESEPTYAVTTTPGYQYRTSTRKPAYDDALRQDNGETYSRTDSTLPQKFTTKQQEQTPSDFTRINYRPDEQGERQDLSKSGLEENEKQDTSRPGLDRQPAGTKNTFGEDFSVSRRPQYYSPDTGYHY